MYKIRAFSFLVDVSFTLALEILSLIYAFLFFIISVCHVSGFGANRCRPLFVPHGFSLIKNLIALTLSLSHIYRVRTFLPLPMSCVLFIVLILGGVSRLERRSYFSTRSAALSLQNPIFDLVTEWIKFEKIQWTMREA